MVRKNKIIQRKKRSPSVTSIRNLREESVKGMQGRLKQGLWPWAAPVGYLDTGQGGKVKEIDPVQGPLIRRLFELYAGGEYNLEELTEQAYRLGLRNRKGSRISLNGISRILNNPFYIGLNRVNNRSETYMGAHEPLIPKHHFDQVQELLRGKAHTKARKHEFLFRRLIQCARCKLHLTGELQKGHAYYRCHNRACPITCVREEVIDEAIRRELKKLQLGDEEMRYARQLLAKFREGWFQERENTVAALNLRLNQLQDRLNRLTDAYLDRLIEKDLFEQRKAALLMERRDLEDKVTEIGREDQVLPERIADFLELIRGAYLAYKVAPLEKKKALVNLVTSNRWASGKNVELALANPFLMVAKRFQKTRCRAAEI